MAGFRAPDRTRYPELAAYTRDELYEDFFGGGGLYLAARMTRTLRLKPGDIVLDLSCGKGPASIFLAFFVSVSVGIILYEAIRQRSARGWRPSNRLSPREIEEYRRRWLDPSRD